MGDKINLEGMSGNKVAVLEFSGKNFSIIDYMRLHFYETNWWNPWSKTKGLQLSIFPDFETTKDGYHLIPVQMESSLSLIDGVELVDRKDGRIDNAHIYASSYYRFLTKGTYSVTDREIELLYSDGSIEVFPFSRTENTISIDKVRFTSVRN